MPIPQIPELLLILMIILIIFGAGKLPEIGNALGKGLSELRRAQTNEEAEKDDQAKA